jgi:hypothetical protein
MSKFAIFLILIMLISISFVGHVLIFSEAEDDSQSLVAQRTSEDPASPEHKFWDSASKLELKTSSNMPAYKVDPFNVTLKAAYNDSSIYLYLKWSDPTKTESVMKGWWSFDGAKWSKSGDDEDRVGILWPITESKGFASVGCKALCHVAPKNPEDVTFLMHAASGEKFDEWHWKAARTNIVGYADDSWMDHATKDPSQPKWDEAAHHSDLGEATYISNEGGPNSGPKYVFNGRASFDRSGRFLAQSDAVEITGNAVAGKAVHDEQCITCHAGPTTLENRKVVQFMSASELKEFLEAGGPNHQGPALQPEDASNSMAYLQTKPEGIPGYLLKNPSVSRADVKASGKYNDGNWQLVLKRALQTKNDDDVQFDITKEYPFGAAIMDNSEWAHSIVPLLKLKFGK